MSDISLFEAMRTQRAIRRFAKDPVSDEAITTILKAAVRAPSGSNRQPWYFLVVRDAEAKSKLANWFLQAWSSIYGSFDPSELPQATRSGRVLAQNMAEVPVLILVCMTHGSEGPAPTDITRGASIYPAVQNLLLAARGLGLGTVLTTVHHRYEDEVKQYLGIPENVETVALIPIGYPAEGEHFGGSLRNPITKVTFYDRWGQKTAKG